MLLINEHTSTNKSSLPGAVSSTNESAKSNAWSQCACTAGSLNTLNPDVQVHLKVCPSLLLPGPGAFISNDSEKLPPYPGGPTNARTHTHTHMHNGRHLKCISTLTIKVSAWTAAHARLDCELKKIHQEDRAARLGCAEGVTPPQLRQMPISAGLVHGH